MQEPILFFFRSGPNSAFSRPLQLHFEPSCSKQGHNRDMKIRRVAEGDLVDGQTQLVWVDSARQAGARADVAVFRSCFCSALFHPLQLQFEPACFKQGHNRHTKLSRAAAGDLVDAQTHLIR